MIDDATIKRVAEECGLGTSVLNSFVWFNDWDGNTRKVLPEFARSIEQLARQEQREADADICMSIYSLPYHDENGCYANRSAAKTCAEAIRASGKENSNE